jgi:hypothetical protein
VFTLSGCSTTYYSVWRKLGDVKKSQKKVGEEFQDALTKVKQLYGLKGAG